MVIGPGDKVAQVLARDERLIEAFVAASPAFARLRNPGLRRTMARLVTVEQAARIAGVEPGTLVERLNAALAGAQAGKNAEATAAASHDRRDMATTREQLPPALAAIPAERIVDLDVREDLRSGREPFSRIMAARKVLPPGSVLRLRAIFEPIPLYQVLAKQGFDHWTERLDRDDWRVWFYPADATAARPVAAEAAASEPAADGDDVVVLDVRGLEPPEPMVRTLAALERLPRGSTLVQLNVRVPQFLLPKLQELGFTHEVREQGEDLVRVFIRHRD